MRDKQIKVRLEWNGEGYVIKRMSNSVVLKRGENISRAFTRDYRVGDSVSEKEAILLNEQTNIDVETVI